MQDIGPDMEDLLRKASENYPLKQSADRWEDIASEINTVPALQPVVRPWRQKKLWIVLGFLLMFLFIKEFDLKEKETSNQFSFHSKQSNREQNNTAKTDHFIPALENTNTETIADKDNFSRLMNTKNTVTQVQGNLPAADGEITYPTEDISLSRADNNKVLINTKSYVINDLHQNTFPYEPALKIAHKTNNLLSPKGIYYGILAGPQFNTVKNQGLKKVGSSAGLIAGYRFNNKFSFETGIWLTNKFYSTAGEHFSMKEIGPAMPAAMKVMEVDGSTRFLEIPVNIRLDVFRNNKRNIFTLAGFSSHIIDEEANQYHTMMNGTEEMLYGTYKKNRGYFASSLNLAIGYDQTVGNKNNLRIQPYIQLPLTGVGVGNLQIRSAGIHIGITRQPH